MTRRRLPVLLAAALLPLAGCSIGNGEVNQEDVEKTAKEALSGQLKRDDFEVECPSGIESEEGAQIVCELQPDTMDPYDLTVTVESVDDGDVNMDFKVADAPRQ